MEEQTTTLPDFDITRAVFLLQAKDDLVSQEEKRTVAATLSEKIQADKLSGIYTLYCQKAGVPIDPSLESEYQSANQAELEKLDAELKNVEENFGDVEVKNALLAKATYCLRVGKKGEALESLDAAYKKTVGAGLRIDNLLMRARLGFFFNDVDLARESVLKAEEELEKGGDWERKNRFLVYKAVLHVSRREFKEAAEIFVKTLATFSSTELLTFKEFVFYAVVTSMVSLDRATVKSKILNSPEVLSVVHEITGLTELMNSLYESRYASFFRSMLPVAKEISRDRYMAPHLLFFIRNLRLNGFRQFLVSYKSVTVQSMADSFGMSADFIDREISSFISTGKLNCKIDKVSGVIESQFTDLRNEVYLKVIKQGDILLNKIQKLSAVIDM